MNTATVTFKTTVKQVTEMFHWPKCHRNKITEMFQQKTTALDTNDLKNLTADGFNAYIPYQCMVTSSQDVFLMWFSDLVFRKNVTHSFVCAVTTTE